MKITPYFKLKHDTKVIYIKKNKDILVDNNSATKICINNLKRFCKNDINYKSSDEINTCGNTEGKSTSQEGEPIPLVRPGKSVSFSLDRTRKRTPTNKIGQNILLNCGSTNKKNCDLPDFSGTLNDDEYENDDELRDEIRDEIKELPNLKNKYSYTKTHSVYDLQTFVDNMALYYFVYINKVRYYLREYIFNLYDNEQCSQYNIGVVSNLLEIWKDNNDDFNNMLKEENSEINTYFSNAFNIFENPVPKGDFKDNISIENIFKYIKMLTVDNMNLVISLINRAFKCKEISPYENSIILKIIKKIAICYKKAKYRKIIEEINVKKCISKIKKIIEEAKDNEEDELSKCNIELFYEYKNKIKFFINDHIYECFPENIKNELQLLKKEIKSIKYMFIN